VLLRRDIVKDTELLALRHENVYRSKSHRCTSNHMSVFIDDATENRSTGNMSSEGFDLPKHVRPSSYGHAASTGGQRLRGLAREGHRALRTPRLARGAQKNPPCLVGSGVGRGAARCRRFTGWSVGVGRVVGAWV
jgi:hypothetical protein